MASNSISLRSIVIVVLRLAIIAAIITVHLFQYSITAQYYSMVHYYGIINSSSIYGLNSSAGGSGRGVPGLHPSEYRSSTEAVTESRFTYPRAHGVNSSAVDSAIHCPVGVVLVVL